MATPLHRLRSVSGAVALLFVGGLTLTLVGTVNLGAPQLGRPTYADAFTVVVGLGFVGQACVTWQGSAVWSGLARVIHGLAFGGLAVIAWRGDPFLATMCLIASAAQLGSGGYRLWCRRRWQI